MHLVFVTSLVPVAEPKSGYDIANRVIVDAMRAAGHRISVLGFLAPGAEPHMPEETRLLGTLEVTNARVGAGRKARWLARAIAGGEPVSVAKMHAAGSTEVAEALAALAPFDGLVLNSVQLPGAFLDRFRSHPFVFVAHNVEARSASDNAGGASGFVSRLLFRREARVLECLEKRLCDLAAHVFTLADADRSDLGIGQGRATTLPLVTSFAPPPAPEARVPVHDIGMIGSWTWAANRTGLDWFLESIVPRLPADFTIAVAGGMSGSPKACPENVHFLGRVADARAFVRSARVIPLVSQVGTGVQLKTIETFEMGLPSVATSNALRGLSHIPENCLRADDPEAFARALVEMVGRARGGEAVDLDGRDFHADQVRRLKAALQSGLSRLGETG